MTRNELAEKIFLQLSNNIAGVFNDDGSYADGAEEIVKAGTRGCFVLADTFLEVKKEYIKSEDGK